ncbi:MAG: UDP-3-O-(3-hydroxymyristoyl)glucosamine N-acyltransferase [Bacteroidales bacterium]|nr:UDP-3-O-(3-hydroxymyristoyl)glucosamine N-acyltransferase [Bacteroidales bacterium]
MLTVAEIAKIIQGEIFGDENVEIKSIAKIEEAKPGDITFLGNKHYEKYLYTTRASAIIVPKSFKPDKEIENVLIFVDNPYLAFTQLLIYLQPASQVTPYISPTAFIHDKAHVDPSSYVGHFTIIEEGARVGKHCMIYPQVYIGKNVTIGDHVILYPGVKIYSECQIGNNCIIHAGAVIGADGFGFLPNENGEYIKIPQLGNVIIEDDVEIGANTTIDRSTLGSTKIGKGTKLDNLIQIGHNVEIGQHNVMAAQVGIAGSTKIGSHNQIGGQVGIAGHLKIGNKCQIGAQSGVIRNIEDGEIVVGAPAMPAKKFFKLHVLYLKLEEIFKKIEELEKK